MGKLTFENRVYDFSWQSIALLFVGAPIFALAIWFSHDWIWLHEISAKITVWLLSIFTNGASYVEETAHATEPWAIYIITKSGDQLPGIRFETLCTGVHAIAIFAGVILFTPHSKDKDTSSDTWLRKTYAVVTTAAVFYIVNIFRMILQLALYRNGANWDDVHYPISAASSFIAVACVLLMHKFVPEFIMSLMWIGDEIREQFAKPPEDVVEGELSPLDEIESTQVHEEKLIIRKEETP